MAVDADIRSIGHAKRIRHFRTRMTANATQDRFTRSYGGGIFYKASGTSPQANEMPRKLGDVCMHFDTEGVFQKAYVCTSFHAGNATCTWTELQVA